MKGQKKELKKKNQIIQKTVRKERKRNRTIKKSKMINVKSLNFINCIKC